MPLELGGLVVGPGVEAIRFWELHFNAPRWVLANELARETPLGEMAECLQPSDRVVRRHGIDERDDEFLG
jgi:hypothetical protein